MGFADLHTHSLYSYDGICDVTAILERAKDIRLDVIAVTDHDSMGGVAEALCLAPQYGVEVIPGMEISTGEGHLLAYWIQQPIPAGMSLVETLRRVKAQGGIATAPHPSGRGACSLSFAAIESALAEPDLRDTLVGIEAFNAGLILTGQNGTIAASAARLPLAQVANSDAHSLCYIGQGSTGFDGRSAEDLRAALLQHRTQPRPAEGVSGAQMVSQYVRGYLMRLLGWGLWNGGPGQPLHYKRLTSLKIPYHPWRTLRPWFTGVPAQAWE